MNKITSSRLRCFYHKYEQLGFLSYVTSVMVMLMMAAAFVYNPQYWIVVLHYQPLFAGQNVWLSEPDWHTWRVFFLTELVCAGFVYSYCRMEEYGRAVQSKWCLGWLAIPLVIFVLRLIWWVIISFLDWRFQISLSVDDIASAFFYTTFLMMLSQLPLVLFVMAEEIEDARQ